VTQLVRNPSHERFDGSLNYAVGTIGVVVGSVLNVRAFPWLAKGDGVTDDTAAIQAALDACAAGVNAVKQCFAPAGNYLFSTLYVPEGVEFFGEGHSETTATTVTKFTKTAAGLGIRVKPHLVGARYFWFGAMHSFTVFGDTAGVGWGISLRDSSGNAVAPQDQTRIHDITVRRCPDGGIELPNGALPLTVARVKLLFNGGPGVKITGGAYLHQAINLEDVSGDGNAGGLISLNSLDANGSVNIYNLKSEKRVNSDFASGAQQPNAIICTGCTGPINIYGATHLSSVPDGGNYEKPGSLVYITDSNIPSINWSGVAIRVRAGDTGSDPGVIEQGANLVPYTVTSGQFGNGNRVDRSTISGVYWTFGPVDDYAAQSAESPGHQLAGVSPGYSLYETDAAADSKAWLFLASGGTFTLRAINDDGTLGQIIFTSSRTQLQVGPDSSGTYLRINGTNATSATGGGATALPAQPTGYIAVNVNGTDRRIPYYAT
jgi:hypothetical protein